MPAPGRRCDRPGRAPPSLRRGSAQASSSEFRRRAPGPCAAANPSRSRLRRRSRPRVVAASRSPPPALMGAWCRTVVRVRQSLDRRPQLIDQHIAVTDLRLLLDTRERVPQRQQAFAAEPGGVQLLPGGNSNFALVHGGWRLAAEGDSVIGDDVNAHGWGLLIDLRGCAGNSSYALFTGQSHSIRDNLMALFGAIRAWNCSAANLARTGRISALWNRIPIERCPGQVGVCYRLDCSPGLSGNIV